jgi:hypothetical protein
VILFLASCRRDNLDSEWEESPGSAAKEDFCFRLECYGNGFRVLSYFSSDFFNTYPILTGSRGFEFVEHDIGCWEIIASDWWVSR